MPVVESSAGVNAGDIEDWLQKKKTPCLIVMSAECALFRFMVSQGGKLQKKKSRKYRKCTVQNILNLKGCFF